VLIRRNAEKYQAIAREYPALVTYLEDSAIDEAVSRIHRSAGTTYRIDDKDLMMESIRELGLLQQIDKGWDEQTRLAWLYERDVLGIVKRSIIPESPATIASEVGAED
jgi:hypothetical protein